MSPADIRMRVAAAATRRTGMCSSEADGSASDTESTSTRPQPGLVDVERLCRDEGAAAVALAPVAVDRHGRHAAVRLP